MFGYWRHKLQGVSLVELMISLVLGTLVLALALRSTIFTYQTQRTLQQALYQHQDAQYALYMLSQSMEQAGYFGCYRAPYPRAWIQHSPDSITFKYGYYSSSPEPSHSHRQGLTVHGGNIYSIRWHTPMSLAKPDQLLLTTCHTAYPIQVGHAGTTLSFDSDLAIHILSWDALTPFPIARRDGNVHLPSLQIVLPLERRYSLQHTPQGAQLIYEDRIAGRVIASAILLSGVHAWRWRYYTQPCNSDRIQTFTQATDLSLADWERLIRVDVILSQAEGPQPPIEFTQTVALTPQHSCKKVT